MKSVDLTVNVPIPEVPVIEEDKYKYIDSNGPLIITPTNGYDAMEKVSAVVNISVPTIESSKSYTIIPPMFVETYPLTFTNTISPSTGYDAMASSTVTVNLVDSSTNAYLLSNIDYISEDGATRTVYYKAPILSDNATSSLMTIMSSEIKQNVQYSGLRRMNFKAKVQNKTITQNGVYYSDDNETILKKITVNVPTQILIDRISYENQIIQFSSFTKNTNSTVSVPDKYFLFNFGINSAKIRIKMYVNNSGGSTNISTYRGDGNYTYYYLGNPVSSSISNYAFLRNSNNDDIIYLYDDTNTDSNAIHIELSTTFFQFVI